MFKELVDIKEDNILQFDLELLNILLKDNSSKKNIIWATNIYSNKGLGYNENDLITIDKITGINGQLIKPRVRKTKDEKSKRILDRAEVFTPSWMCNIQNNLIDTQWFGRKDVFNKEKENSWETNIKKIKFKNKEQWKEYVSLLRLEISCGEAPYLVSRYDTVTGKSINVEDRIGILDRKFRVINENVKDIEEWLKWATIALQSTYGYDWQGDNVLLARENVLYTFSDNYKYKFGKKPDVKTVKEIAEIITWNIWQMDGIKGVIPNSCILKTVEQLSLFGEKDEEKKVCRGCLNNNYRCHNGKYVKIMDWVKNKKVRFIDIMK